MVPYTPAWFLQDGLVQTFLTTYWYGTSWNWLKGEVPWLNLPMIPWCEQVFHGAEDVPLWGLWSCPPKAKGTMIISYGITGRVEEAWYAQVLARKAYHRNWAVVLYDWRSHGRTAEYTPIPSSDGWREGVDQVLMAEQLIKLGCPKDTALAGFSLGGQLILWGLQAAVAESSPQIRCAAALAPNLESNRSLAYLRTTLPGQIIEGLLVKELKIEAQKRQERFPQAVKPGAVARINSISDFDQEMVIDYYGFPSVEDYYQKTSGLYLLDQLRLPYLVIYAEDDPMFDPALVPEIRQRIQQNPLGQLLMTPQGGHVAHINRTSQEDEFWGLNRMLAFCEENL